MNQAKSEQETKEPANSNEILTPNETRMLRLIRLCAAPSGFFNHSRFRRAVKDESKKDFLSFVNLPLEEAEGVFDSLIHKGFITVGRKTGKSAFTIKVSNPFKKTPPGGDAG